MLGTRRGQREKETHTITRHSEYTKHTHTHTHTSNRISLTPCTSTTRVPVSCVSPLSPHHRCHDYKQYGDDRHGSDTHDDGACHATDACTIVGGGCRVHLHNSEAWGTGHAHGIHATRCRHMMCAARASVVRMHASMNVLSHMSRMALSRCVLCCVYMLEYALHAAYDAIRHE